MSPLLSSKQPPSGPPSRTSVLNLGPKDYGFDRLGVEDTTSVGSPVQPRRDRFSVTGTSEKRRICVRSRRYASPRGSRAVRTHGVGSFRRGPPARPQPPRPERRVLVPGPCSQVRPSYEPLVDGSPSSSPFYGDFP